MKQKKVYIETYGCQMNKYDSELATSILAGEGYQVTHHPGEADLILVNTCSVRDHAEMRALGRLGALNAHKLANPRLKIGVMGCMAQRIGEQILKEKRFVDFAIGPDSYRSLPAILDRLKEDNARQICADITDFEVYLDIYPNRESGVSAWVAIMRGCNNFCAYCIVPYLRGRERSRPADNVLDEIRQLSREGFKEVSLLGQNVNSYHDGDVDFPELISRVSQVDGILRVRFASSHPKDLSEKLIRAIAAHRTICNHIHLAVQSGSNKILKLMNRNYTREHFLSLLEKARNLVEGISFTTDIIVGFPEETEHDFHDTLDLVQQAQFDNAFIFKYNPRSGTAAAEMQEAVTEEEKLARLIELNELQNSITLNRNRELIGCKAEVLVEGRSKKSATENMGRTDTNKIVIFPARSGDIGKIVGVQIAGAEGHTLFGEFPGI
ncbi:tRNA (N6-isopentenyl adenosine(37)-C2)-methylthiotransferase MiaB [candidate division KSB1 bacterium]|nr:tRNA (N6-isopentenyl adenosine(37)-C2)-methylthiotransferase MiaB [candidate division KSB1 bacterium]